MHWSYRENVVAVVVLLIVVSGLVAYCVVIMVLEEVVGWLPASEWRTNHLHCR